MKGKEETISNLSKRKWTVKLKRNVTRRFREKIFVSSSETESDLNYLVKRNGVRTVNLYFSEHVECDPVL
jgi:hypothetical protein